MLHELPTRLFLSICHLLDRCPTPVLQRARWRVTHACPLRSAAKPCSVGWVLVYHRVLPQLVTSLSHGYRNASAPMFSALQHLGLDFSDRKDKPRRAPFASCRTNFSLHFAAREDQQITPWRHVQRCFSTVHRVVAAPLVCLLFLQSIKLEPTATYHR